MCILCFRDLGHSIDTSSVTCSHCGRAIHTACVGAVKRVREPIQDGQCFVCEDQAQWGIEKYCEQSKGRSAVPVSTAITPAVTPPARLVDQPFFEDTLRDDGRISSTNADFVNEQLDIIVRGTSSFSRVNLPAPHENLEAPHGLSRRVKNRSVQNPWGASRFSWGVGRFTLVLPPVALYYPPYPTLHILASPSENKKQPPSLIIGRLDLKIPPKRSVDNTSLSIRGVGPLPLFRSSGQFSLVPFQNPERLKQMLHRVTRLFLFRL